jgi:hypothetical protein
VAAVTPSRPTSENGSGNFAGVVWKGDMTMHIAVSIRGLEDRLLGRVPRKYGTWEILQDDTGRFLTKTEVWKEIDRCKKFGYEVIPNCDNVDARGFCKGHGETEQDTTGY